MVRIPYLLGNCFRWLHHMVPTASEFSALAEGVLPPSKLGHYTIFLVRGGGGGGGGGGRGGGGFVSPYRHAVVHVGNGECLSSVTDWF